MVQMPRGQTNPVCGRGDEKDLWIKKLYSCLPQTKPFLVLHLQVIWSPILCKPFCESVASFFAHNVEKSIYSPAKNPAKKCMFFRPKLCGESKLKPYRTTDLSLVLICISISINHLTISIVLYDYMVLTCIYHPMIGHPMTWPMLQACCRSRV